MVPTGALYELEFNHGSQYGEEELAALAEVLRASAPSCGPKTQEFERAFAGYCGTASALAVTSATHHQSLALTVFRLTSVSLKSPPGLLQVLSLSAEFQVASAGFHGTRQVLNS